MPLPLPPLLLLLVLLPLPLPPPLLLLLLLVLVVLLLPPLLPNPALGFRGMPVADRGSRPSPPPWRHRCPWSCVLTRGTPLHLVYPMVYR